MYNNKLLLGRIGIVSLALVSTCNAQLNTGVISGTLQGEDGTALDGTVSLRLVRANLNSRFQRAEWAAKTGPAGTFQFQALAYGSYILCASAAPPWLNQCEWGPAPPTVSLSISAPSASVKIVLKKGVAVPVRVDDPGGLLSQHEGKTPGAALLLGIGAPGYVFRLLPIVSSDAGGRNHQILIPFNTPIKLIVHSAFFHLNNGLGQELGRDQAAQFPLAVASDQQISPIKFTVTGAGR